MRFEHRSQPLLPRREYVARLVKSAGLAATLIAGSLLVGVLGYRFLGGLGWIDAVQNASMILGGMGPVDRLDTVAGKLFASAYALFSGFMLLTSVAVLIAPMFHRIMHRLHLEKSKGE